ncbi:MAG: family 43 glycosylhydrolase [Bdellovibrionota bacterium]|nr:family 43 glycosylhydrolase [Bdellovibrionota bacterium]
MKRILFSMLIMASLKVALAVDIDAERYENPVTTFGCADPGVLKDISSSGYFFLACTGGRFRIRKSTDLINWSNTSNYVIPSTNPNGIMSFAGYNASWNPPKRNWAPHLYKYNDKYRALVTQNGKGSYGIIGQAQTTDIETLDFEETKDTALVRSDNIGGAIDPSYFLDTDGKHYLLWKVDGNSRGMQTSIKIRKLSPNGKYFQGSTSEHILKTGGNTLATLVEGQELIKHQGKYYLFFSHGSYLDSYKVKVVRADTIYGPYIGERTILSERPNGRYFGPGHGTITKVNGKHYYFYHAYDRTNNNGTRYAMLDRIYFRNGWPIIHDGHPSETPTYKPLSNKSLFPEVLFKWTTNFPSPHISLDVKSKTGQVFAPCVNASVLTGRSSYFFDGKCVSANNQVIELDSAAKYRICVATNGNFTNPSQSKCTSYKNISSEVLKDDINK